MKHTHEFHDKQRRIQALLEQDRSDALLRMRDIFRHGMSAYSETGCPEEWQFHRQGGLAGYEPREVIATSDSEEIVSAGQVFAWNPSIADTKLEDTILVTGQGCQTLTEIKDWPTIPVEIDGQAFFRPAILER